MAASNEVQVIDLGGVSIGFSINIGEVVITIKKVRNSGKFFKSVIALAALSACSFTQASVLDFEAPIDNPFIYAGDHVAIGDYWIEAYSGNDIGSFVGAIVDGSDNGICIDLACPVNNKSHYYAGLDDSYFYFGLNDNSSFMVKSLSASFIGAGQASFPATSGILVLQGFDALGAALGSSIQVPLAGPTAGSFNFSNFDLGTFGNTYFSYVRVLGYACDTSTCSRTTDLSNFAIDNIETVPEPTSIALLGLGAAGLAFARRRRAA